LLATYFCDPYASWQKGGVKNANGILRQYIPKGAEAEDFTEGEIEAIMWLINNMPRKSLGYKTAYEMFDGLMAQEDRHVAV
jgi:IS30 family transposase